MTPVLYGLLGVLFIVAAASLITWTLALVAGWRENDLDQERAMRIQREYGLPEHEVPEPTGRRVPPRELPEIVSRYRDEPSR